MDTTSPPNTDLNGLIDHLKWLYFAQSQPLARLHYRLAELAGTGRLDPKANCELQHELSRYLRPSGTKPTASWSGQSTSPRTRRGSTATASRSSTSSPPHRRRGRPGRSLICSTATVPPTTTRGAPASGCASRLTARRSVLTPRTCRPSPDANDRPSRHLGPRPGLGDGRGGADRGGGVDPDAGAPLGGAGGEAAELASSAAPRCAPILGRGHRRHADQEHARPEIIRAGCRLCRCKRGLIDGEEFDCTRCRAELWSDDEEDR
jgi:hypothetical protein